MLVFKLCFHIVLIICGKSQSMTHNLKYISAYSLLEIRVYFFNAFQININIKCACLNKLAPMQLLLMLANKQKKIKAYCILLINLI